MNEQVQQALSELADEAHSNGNANEWVNERVKVIQDAFAHQRQGGKAVYQVWCSGGWDDVNEREFQKAAEKDRRTLCTTPAAPVQGEPVLYVRQMDLDHSKQYPQRSVITTPLAADDWNVPLYAGPAAQADEVRDASDTKLLDFVDAERFCEGDPDDVRVTEHMWHATAALRATHKGE